MSVFRIPPKMAIQAYKTYSLRSPRGTHTMKATCAQVDCPHRREGWVTRIDVGTELGVRQANYIRLHSGRSFVCVETGTLVTFTFAPGQTCFSEHRVPLDRPAFYTVRGGDWRSNTGLIRSHMRGEDWVDDFANHQDKLATEINKG